MDNNHRYPLLWPDGYPRTKTKQFSKFGEHSLTVCVKELHIELHRMGASEIILSSNVLRNAYEAGLKYCQS